MTKTPSTFKFTPVPADRILALVASTTRCEIPAKVPGKGEQIVTTLLKSKNPAHILQFDSVAEATRTTELVRQYVKRAKLIDNIWVTQRKSCDGADLLIINVKRAPAAVRKQFANRPRRGVFSAA